MFFFAPRKPLLYSNENETLMGHPQSLAIETIRLVLVSIQEFSFPNRVPCFRSNFFRALGFSHVPVTKLAFGWFSVLHVVLLGRNSHELKRSNRYAGCIWK